MIITRSARIFQERVGLIPTNRQPGPIFDGGGNRAHTEPVPCPYPVPELLTQGHTPADTVLTIEPWPDQDCVATSSESVS